MKLPLTLAASALALAACAPATIHTAAQSAQMHCDWRPAGLIGGDCRNEAPKARTAPQPKPEPEPEEPEEPEHPEEPEKPSRPETPGQAHKPKGNNGWGNGDQSAPGNSGGHNNAENSSRPDPRGGKRGKR